VLAANPPREFAFCSLENAYLAGQKTARAQAATKQFSRTNPIAISCHTPLLSRSASGLFYFNFAQLIVAKKISVANYLF
jgi:hypothetical protein